MSVELYVNTENSVDLDLILAASVATPVATLRETGEDDVDLTVSSGTADDGYAEKWTVDLPETTYDRTYTLTWTWEDASAPRTRNDFFEIVTPYNTPEDLAIRYGWIYEGANANKDRDEVVLAERLARLVINNYTDSKFGKYRTQNTAYGMEADMLYLSEHILEVYSLSENGVTMIDNRSDPVVADFGYPVDPTETGFSVRIQTEYDISESQVTRVVTRTGRFNSGYRYVIDGIFGWNYVPTPVAEAAAILTNDYMCNDASWRARYINKVEVRDWKFNFEKDAYRGTGNAFADQLLQAYRSDGMLVI